MDYKRAKILLEKYFEGDSSVEEEKILKEYFTKNASIPSDLEYAKDMFVHFEKESAIAYEGPLLQKTPVIKRKLFYRISGIAASLLLILTTIFYIQEPKEEVVYAYINGKPVTDKSIAIQETNKALTLVSNNLNQGTKDLNYLSKLTKVKKLISNN